MKNGVDVESLEKTCALITENPDLGKSQFRVVNTWKEGGCNTSCVKGYYAAGQEHKHDSNFEFNLDEPRELLGEDKGANPVEFLLTALSGCMTTSMVYHAAAQGYTIEKMRSEFKGDLDLQGFLNLSDTVPKGYQNIEVVFYVTSDAPIEELEKFYQFSPVYSMVSQAVPIEVTFVKE
jgi:uncharacterized OsmC-like protein